VKRLCGTLLFLATGRNYEDGNFNSAISPQAVGVVILETCKTISEELNEEYCTGYKFNNLLPSIKN
jgi:hypothetical protein